MTSKSDSHSFWRGRRVLITGHTGFKGSWLSLWLQTMGAEVTGYALPPDTDPNLYMLANVASGMNSVMGDVRDLSSLESVFQQSKPEIVLHLAAQALVRLSYDEPVDTYAVNVMGTVNVLECIRKTKSVRAAIIVTSDKCYDNKEQQDGYLETDPMGGFDPYSSSKGCAELVTQAYRTSYFKKSECAVASARAGNVIGGGDWSKDRLVPDILSSFANKTQLLIRYPDSTRPWQHVLEPLSGYLLLAEKLWHHGQEFAEGWNFGPSEEDVKPVRWIIDCLAKHCDITPNWAVAPGIHPHEARYLALNSMKAKTKLDWSSRWTLDQSLAMIAAWYIAMKAGKNLRNETLSQIHSFIQSSSQKTAA
jgi:CDP-glucose 4,6-dehydratase